MGLPANSFEHDAALELACHWLIDKFLAHDGTLPPVTHQRAYEWLRAVQDTRSYQRPHARTSSPHRHTATAWEALLVDWKQNPDNPAALTALIACCTRIVTSVLDVDDLLGPMNELCRQQAAEARRLFDAEAGQLSRSRALDALQSIGIV